MIMSGLIGGYPIAPKTCIFELENGDEVVAVFSKNEVIFTATKDDIREGKVAASNLGIVTGDKVIPAYHTCHGFRLITAGSSLTIPNIMSDIDSYDYTKLQCLICAYNTTPADSVYTQKVLIEDNIYNIQSIESVSTVVKNHDTKTIELGITNDSDSILVLRYFMYKEIE